MRNWKEVPVPERMQALDRDSRGYPIPANVLRKNDGAPVFTINDERFTQLALDNALCPICAQKLDRGGWFVGGPISCLFENGAFIDLPMHEECAEYALRVCPYLAAPNYSKRIDAAQVKEGEVDQLITVDPSVIPNRPDVFIMFWAVRFEVRDYGPGQRYLVPERPPLGLRFWSKGSELDIHDPEQQEEIRGLVASSLQSANDTGVRTKLEIRR